MDPHYGKIVEDMDDGLLNEGDRENAHARKFIKRVTDKRNLEASNELFAKLVEEIHKRGMKVILDGVFNHCGSFNKWMDRERIYENQEGYPKGAYISADSPIGITLISMTRTAGRTILPMMDGGLMILCRS